MTRGDLIFECSRALGLEDTADSDELKLMQRWANRGVRDVLVRTGVYVDLGDMTLQPGVTDYRIDSSILRVNTIHVTSAVDTSQVSPVEVVPMQTLDEYLDANPAASDPTMIALNDTLMRVAPVPSGANVIRFYYVPSSSDMTDDADDPSDPAFGGVPLEYHEAILYFMLWKGAEYDDKQSLKPQEYRQAYEGLLADVRRQSRRKSGRGLRGARVGYPRRSRFPYSRNDIYPPYQR